MVIQQQIDTEGYNGKEIIEVDPIGGGVDVLYRVGILDAITSNPYSRRLIQWKPSDDVPDVVPGEGRNDNVHFIGIPYGESERFAFVECPEAGSYTLEIPSFSEVSDEVVVRRVFCAALRPTNAGFTFANPIKNITVSASADTVNLQVIALDELKTVKSTDAITVTHTQDFPCVFGIVYKHKADGEIVGGGSQPEPAETVFRQTFNFRLNNKVNFIHATLDGNGKAFDITGITFSSLGGFIRYKGLACFSTDGRTDILDTELNDYEINSYIEQAMQEQGGIQNITSPITIMTTVLGLQSDPDEYPVGCEHDIVVTVFYKTHEE